MRFTKWPARRGRQRSSSCRAGCFYPAGAVGAIVASSGGGSSTQTIAPTKFGFSVSGQPGTTATVEYATGSAGSAAAAGPSFAVLTGAVRHGA